MSRHHMLPPVIYTPPPPKKIETKKRRIGVGASDELDETAQTHETVGSGQSAPIANKSLQQNFPEIENSDRKPQGPAGRLSQDTLTVLLRAQEAT
ncbi:MAG TPA: hypothetical protein VKT76_18460 [Bradyrhizobium sp.]|nr:hypothetical protein [Bradyrhizobium sp.]